MPDWALDGEELSTFRDSHATDLEITWLLRHDVNTLRDLSRLSNRDISQWRGFGGSKTSRILSLAERLNARAVELVVAQSQPSTTLHSQSSMQTLLGETATSLDSFVEWAQFSAGAVTVEDVVKSLGHRDLPDDLASHLQTVLALPLPRTSIDPLDDIRRWTASLDERSATVLARRLVRFESATLDVLGQEFGVTRERVRQIETKLKQRLAAWIESSEGRGVRWAVHVLSQGLGAYAPDGEVPLVGDDGGRSDEFGLLLYLSDMVWDRDRGVIRRRTFSLPSVPDIPVVDGGPIVDEDALRELLGNSGIVDPHVDWALEQIAGLRRLDDSLVLWPANMLDQAVAVLSVEGRPLPEDKIAQRIGRDINVRGLRNRLLEDPSITRVNKTDFGLASWGMPEYSGIVPAMIERLEKVGPTTVRELADYLAERHDIKPGSVVAYSAAPVFKVDDRVIRLRRADEPYMPTLNPADVRGLFRLSDTQSAWLVRVDRDLLRGSGRLCPAELATALGVFPGLRETLTNRVRDVTVSWSETSHMGPTISSLRAHVESLGLREGAWLRLVIDRAQHTISISELAHDGSPLARLGAALGLASAEIDAEELARAVFADEGAAAQTLLRRGDIELAEAAALLESSAP